MKRPWHGDSLAWILLLASLWATAAPGTSDASSAGVRRSWPTMGTYAEVILPDGDTEAAVAAVEAVRSTFDRVNRTMSVYRAESDLSRVNRGAEAGPVRVDPWLTRLVRLSKRAARVTDGAFSLNVLTPGVRRGLKPAHYPVGPWEPGMREVEVLSDPPRIRFRRRGIALDSGGVAKGFALDRAARLLRDRGIHRFLIRLGRSLYAGQPPRDRRGWPVRLEGDPGIRWLTGGSIAVSRQGLRSDTGHILDPRTGRPVSGRRWVGVEASRGWVADMASTALMVDPTLRRVLREAFPSIRWVVIRSEDEGRDPGSREGG